MNPARLMKTPCLVYPAAADDVRDEYNDIVLAVGAPVPAKCWTHQTQTDELTIDNDTATERWTVYLPLVDDDGNDLRPDFVAAIDVPELSLRLQVEGAPHVWRHPTKGPLFIELQASMADDAWVS